MFYDVPLPCDYDLRCLRGEMDRNARSEICVTQHIHTFFQDIPRLEAIQDPWFFKTREPIGCQASRFFLRLLFPIYLI